MCISVVRPLYILPGPSTYMLRTYDRTQTDIHVPTTHTYTPYSRAHCQGPTCLRLDSALFSIRAVCHTHHAGIRHGTRQRIRPPAAAPSGSRTGTQPISCCTSTHSPPRSSQRRCRLQIIRNTKHAETTFHRVKSNHGALISVLT